MAMPDRAAAAGTADAVHIVFGELGQVEVDHMRDAADVDAARRHIGRHQHAHVAVAHVEQGAVAFALVHVAVQCRDRHGLVRTICLPASRRRVWWR